MNFGGGGSGGYGAGNPMFPNAGFIPPGMVFPGATGMQPMLSTMPGMPPQPQFIPSYPQGQGPLANREARVGANGLLVAPELEGPEEHEGKQFIKLNVVEEMKYSELWNEASQDGEIVSGEDMVKFLSRAEKLSKSQSRLIWDLSDHRKEGSLDRDQFFVALRLLALAQRGAELSMNGLRNFVGIQLLPSMREMKKEEQQVAAAEPTEDQNLSSLSMANIKPFSWTVVPAQMSRYDKFFDDLDSRKIGQIDGKQGVAFFGKSGLPRTTLKLIWQLADITADGKLDREEFRQAMHLVTGVKNGRIKPEQFPDKLDPAGALWVRVATPQTESTPLPPQPPGVPPQVYQAQPELAPSPRIGAVPAPPSARSDGAPSPQLGGTGFPIQTQGQSAILLGEASGSASMSPHVIAQPPAVNMTPSPISLQAQNEAEMMRAALQKERIEAEKARKEMEQIQAELQQVRLEKEKAAANEKNDELEKIRREYNEMLAAKQRAENEAAAARAELERTKELGVASKSISHAPPSDFIPPVPSNASAVGSMRIFDEKTNAQRGFIPPVLQTSSVSGNVQSTITQPSTHSLSQKEADDIWDQPSPKASSAAPNVKPIPSLDKGLPPTKASLTGSAGARAQAKITETIVESGSDDDDDDFWGTGALSGNSKATTFGTKNTSGKQSNAQGQGGLGGSALDEWLF